MKRPLLSICIPTRNRSPLLSKMLENIVSLPTFLGSDEIEVVISDNASDDDTREVAMRHVEKFPGKVRYFCNSENVLDDNFRIALTRGEGEYLKLANDTLLFTDDGLKTMLETVRAHLEDRPLIYFRSLAGDFAPCRCKSLDELLRRVGVYITWIAEYGIWRDDFAAIKDFGRARDLWLIQVDAQLREMARKRDAVVVTRLFFVLQPRPVAGGGGNAAQIFGRNLCQLMKPYLAAGELSRATYEYVKWNAFLHCVFANFISTKPGFVFRKDHYFKYLLPDFWWKWYIYAAYPFVVAARIIAPLRRLVGK